VNRLGTRHRSLRGPLSGLACTIASVLVLTACSATGPGESRVEDRATARQAASETSATPTTTTASGVTVVAVGDVACAAGEPTTATKCRQADTARLTRAIDPAHVIALGDLQYQSGTLTQFRASYDASWGSLKPITKPLPGNHEYYTRGAAGYYRYFDRSAPGYYAWSVGRWRIYNLNSNCDKISCAAETDWFRRQLSRYPRKCTIVAMHHPRFSSGLEHGNNPSVGRFWKVAYNHRVDIALAGHDHDYERFARLSPGGDVQPSRGIQSFVSGAGGKSLYHLGTRKKGSKVFRAGVPGVLQLRLDPGSYSWKFRTVDGRTPDSGSRTCV